jgi:SAM-dependent methyltransferase
MAVAYFEQVQYRSPEHPVTEAYVRPKLDYIRRFVPLDKRTSLLDVGCGNGVFTHHLEKLCGFVSGLDNSGNMLAQNPCPRVVQGEGTDLPFRDGSFDVVFEANVLHHVKDRIRVVREMSRVSRRWVILIEPNRYNPLMLVFGLVIPAERGLLTSTTPSNLAALRAAGLKPAAWMTTGMISQNNTPSMLLPFLKRFDREIWYGEYIVLIAEKPAP